VSGLRARLRGPDALIALAAALGVALFVARAAALDAPGFPLDDAWIHQTYARNLAERGEWAFVPGQPSAASTAPLYTLALAVGYALRLPFFAWAFALGALTLALGGWVARRLGAALFPGERAAGLLTGLAAVTAWHLVWAAASGMETSLFAALSLLVVWMGARLVFGPPEAAPRSGALLGVAGAALAATRLEGAALFALTLALALVAGRRGARGLAVGALAAAAVFALAILPLLALNQSLGGTPLPDTAAAKQGEYAIYRTQWSLPERAGRMLLPLLASSLILLLPGVACGLVDLARRVRADLRLVVYLAPALWVGALVGVYALRLPASYQHGRYVMPIVPHLLLYGVGGTLTLIRAARRRPLARVLTRSLGLAAVLVTLAFWGIGARQYAEDVRIINTEMVATARWVRANIPPEDLLAVHDIGALGYYAPRPILDLAGLVSPEVVPIIRDDAALMDLMCAREVRYLMALPDQLPAPPGDPRLGAPVFTTEAPYASRAAGYANHMSVYELLWPEGCGANERPPGG